MIDIDFSHVYPSKGNSLCFKGDQFIVKIIQLMISSLKDGTEIYCLNI